MNNEAEFEALASSSLNVHAIDAACAALVPTHVWAV